MVSVSDKMRRVIACLFEALEEVTPLMLQKLLYFIQGIYLASYEKPIFVEDCEAWVHGPVYPKVYELFKDFKYNPIDDARYAMLKGTDHTLTDEEKKVIDLVVNTFGLYGGKVLERITHSEEPWLNARRGYADGIPSNELLPKSEILKYYKLVDRKYKKKKKKGLNSYISDILKQTFFQ